MGGACGMYSGEEMCLEVIVGETSRKVTAWRPVTELKDKQVDWVA
jgi:hypothetical protein